VPFVSCWPVADATVAGPSVRNWSKFRHQSQARLTVVGGATVARTRRPLARKEIEAEVRCGSVRDTKPCPRRRQPHRQVEGVLCITAKTGRRWQTWVKMRPTKLTVRAVNCGGSPSVSGHAEPDLYRASPNACRENDLLTQHPAVKQRKIHRFRAYRHGELRKLAKAGRLWTPSAMDAHMPVEPAGSKERGQPAKLTGPRRRKSRRFP
jgi:hypothetical protein